MEGFIFNIQHFSLHDGPGIRTTVFLKGCTLRCAWCHNPESISPREELLYFPNLCISCGRCAAVCPAGAHTIDEEGRHGFHRSKCVLCGACTQVCNAKALELCGKSMRMEEVVREVLRDRDLYASTGGGVTFSGGEPLLQSDFVAEAVKALKEEGIHVAVDTALNVPVSAVRKAAEHADLFLADFKLWDGTLHQEYTGLDNALIRRNLELLAAYKPIIIRIPIVGGVNDDPGMAEQAAAYLSGLGENIKAVELLSYHDLGRSKCEALGIPFQKFAPPSGERLGELAEAFKARGLEVKIS